MAEQPTEFKTEPKSAFAVRIGLSRARVSQLVNDGMPLAPSGEVLIDAALAWLAVRRFVRLAPPPSAILNALAAEIGCEPEVMRAALRGLVARHADAE